MDAKGMLNSMSARNIMAEAEVYRFALAAAEEFERRGGGNDMLGPELKRCVVARVLMDLIDAWPESGRRRVTAETLDSVYKAALVRLNLSERGGDPVSSERRLCVAVQRWDKTWEPVAWFRSPVHAWRHIQAACESGSDEWTNVARADGSLCLAIFMGGNARHGTLIPANAEPVLELRASARFRQASVQ